MVRRLLLATTFTAAACGPTTTPPSRCEVTPGALVLTEVFANPAGDDGDREWFEVYNPGPEPVPLAGLSLAVSAADGSAEKTTRLPSTAPEIEPGAYFVFGNAETALPEWLDYSYGKDLKALPNGSGKVSILCGSVEIDSVVWTVAAKDDTSFQLDGRDTPDADANDSSDAWCFATAVFEPTGFKGSPGAANEACPRPVDPTSCRDPVSGERRAKELPGEGDLVFTELMPNPAAVDDNKGEWVELYARRDVDLNGLTFGVEGSPTSVLGGDDCLRVTEGSYVLLGRNADVETNGGIEGIVATFGRDLQNTGERVVALMSGDVVVDRVTYSNAPAGKAFQLSPDQIDADANDAPEAWCLATTPLPNGDFGTPGAANPSCDTVAPGAQCVDPVSGESRPVVAPEIGELVITEFMAAPKGVNDADGEWIEFLALADVDLNGVEVRNEGNGRSALAPEETCLRVTAGSYVLLARKADSAVNGGLPEVLRTFSFNLANSAPSGGGSRGIRLVSGDSEIDSVTYVSATSGVSRQLSNTALDAVANDADANWCAGTADIGGGGNKGTPGAPNAACP